MQKSVYFLGVLVGLTLPLPGACKLDVAHRPAPSACHQPLLSSQTKVQVVLKKSYPELTAEQIEAMVDQALKSYNELNRPSVRIEDLMSRAEHNELLLSALPAIIAEDQIFWQTFLPPILQMHNRAVMSGFSSSTLMTILRLSVWAPSRLRKRLIEKLTLIYSIMMPDLVFSIFMNIPAHRTDDLIRNVYETFISTMLTDTDEELNSLPQFFTRSVADLSLISQAPWHRLPQYLRDRFNHDWLIQPNDPLELHSNAVNNHIDYMSCRIAGTCRRMWRTFSQIAFQTVPQTHLYRARVFVEGQLVGIAKFGTEHRATDTSFLAIRQVKDSAGRYVLAKGGVYLLTESFVQQHITPLIGKGGDIFVEHLDVRPLTFLLNTQAFLEGKTPPLDQFGIPFLARLDQLPLRQLGIVWRQTLERLGADELVSLDTSP